MGAVRLLRTLAPLALLAAVATGCGSGSSSTAASDPLKSLEPGDNVPTNAATGLPTTGTTSGLVLRPVFGRYTSGAPLGLGPQAPKDLISSLKKYDCASSGGQLQGMTVECGTDKVKSVYLLKDPVLTGGVASATPKQIGHKNLWFVEVQLDQQASDQLASATGAMSGTELAVTLHQKVLTAPVIYKPITDGSFAITGSYNHQQATKLAAQVAQG
jgi:hypothetical protein